MYKGAAGTGNIQNRSQRAGDGQVGLHLHARNDCTDKFTHWPGRVYSTRLVGSVRPYLAEGALWSHSLITPTPLVFAITSTFGNRLGNDSAVPWSGAIPTWTRFGKAR